MSTVDDYELMEHFVAKGSMFFKRSTTGIVLLRSSLFLFGLGLSAVEWKGNPLNSVSLSV